MLIKIMCDLKHIETLRHVQIFLKDAIEEKLHQLDKFNLKIK